ncbi:MAG: hypothetical protein EP297_14575 [Gammaproteobacteria bacterium]|nr:MAG: hypothetical protein EP297_14575 [Gammaproteobacteria bacterium]
MTAQPKSGAGYKLATSLFGVLLMLLSSPALSQDYTPLRAEAGSSGYFTDELEAFSLAYGPEQMASDPGKPFLKDAHTGIRDYARRSCESCHAEQADNLHAKRDNIGCRQCHGHEPVASIHHYYSAMNPIRRHAYVCAKCHEGASASFATYLVHSPAAARDREVLASFPALYWTDWFMFLLIVGVFIVFIPHSIG